jgi:phosphatidylglycerophosphate synthase
MLDRKTILIVQTLLSDLAKLLFKKNIRANTLTIVGFSIGLLSVPCIINGWFLLGVLLILINRIFDALDGMVARLSSSSDLGAFLDITLDFIFYATVPVSFAFYNPVQNALPALILVLSFVGTGSSFLAFSIIAQKRNFSAKYYSLKGIYYSVGLIEGTETILTFILMCLFPNYFPVIAYLFSIACFVTVLIRIKSGWSAFSDK